MIDVCTTVVGTQVVQCLGREGYAQDGLKESRKGIGCADASRRRSRSPRVIRGGKGMVFKLKRRGSTRGSHDIMVARAATRSSESN